jgi:AcrR family transcriptional regulator
MSNVEGAGKGATEGTTHGSVPDPDVPSLRSEQVRQTRAALVAAGRVLFGRDGFAATSVEDLAKEARVTTGALYHHFPTKTALFETVFQEVHGELLAESAAAAEGSADLVDVLVTGFEAFLDAVLQPEVQRIVVTDAPAVLGLARFTELDERDAFAEISFVLRAAKESRQLEVEEPDILARLLLGALTRGAMLIASSADPAATRDAVARSIRELLLGMRPKRGGRRPAVASPRRAGPTARESP